MSLKQKPAVSITVLLAGFFLMIAGAGDYGWLLGGGVLTALAGAALPGLVVALSPPRPPLGPGL